ncbi:filamentous hemagglutinin N-terminal domain-containing protein [Microbulbifer sp. GL-2]|uniref:filamentous hemagglutinin N-terminal domain-containing protein n=1 Tax=Microbulbifer sp. GL-2 TaxID=2591606 RepID=UPI00116252C2|nr:filamentous hemagglutinin N-terminal domain-containing protein [Microbulbifer sp. GL-2]BBM00984.1 hypothetical protein GL2_10580 [Microbulbifer sp. GL-2]
MKAKNKKLELRKLASAIKVSSFAYAGLFAGLISPMAHAGPEGGTVTGGSGTIDVNGTTTTVDQVTDLLSIDWDSFNLTKEELVQFLQPDSSSIVLNRILDQDVTTIQGAIEANGHVILVNPRGVLFTETATVNVGAITASGLDMSPEDFMNGDFAFKGESGSSGVVINRGVINASSAVLVGKQVTNASTGLISAELVSLAAADEALLTFDADGMIGIKVTKEVMENDLGLDSAVLNEGAIDGAQVLMEASVSGDLFTAAVNNEGTITAHGIDTSGGKIRLFGSGSGVVNSGTLDASGSVGGEVVLEGDFAEHSGDISVAADSGSGGEVNILGDEVVVSGDINARGTTSGGEVLIGGDYQGGNEDIRNAKTTTVTAEATIDASGIGDADGGTVIVWADDTTNFGGTIFAESGEDGGDGGLVETSGKIYLNLDEDNMFVSTLSHGDGETGLWLLDPGWMEITSSCAIDASNCVSTGALVDALATSDVTIQVTDADSGSYNGDGLEPGVGDDADAFSYGISVVDDIDWGGFTTLFLQSYADVSIADGVTISADNGALDIQAGGSFTNAGSIDVVEFNLAVGVDPFSGTISDTTNTLGDIKANTATVTGGSGTDIFILSDNDDAITIDDDNEFTLVTTPSGANNSSATISFTGIEEVDLGEGDNSIAAISNTTASLSGVDNEAKISAIDFSNISSVTGGSLEGSDSADTLVVTSGTSVTANGISFSSLSSTTIDTKDGEDTVTGADDKDWTLTGNNYQATNNGITFSNVEFLTAVNADLIGTGGNDAFVLQSDTDVAIYNMTISGMSSVEGNGGTDSLDASAYSAGLALTGADNQVTAESGNLTFNAIASAVTAVLTGTSSADSFTVDGDNAVTSYDIAFTGVNTVDAGSGGGSVAAQSIVSLTGTDKEATTNLIAFSNIDSVSGGSLEGSDNADTFEVNSGTSVTANGISFSSLSSTTIDTKDGEDTVTGADGEDWTLTGNNYQATNNGITFSNVEFLTAVNADLIGTTGADAFVLQSDADVAIYNMTISGMSSVEGNGGTDSLDASAYSVGLALTGTDNQASAESGNLTFNAIASAVTAVLTGTSGADSFTVSGDNAASAYGVAFTGLNTIDAAGGTDSVTGASGADWALTGTNKEATSSNITFSAIETITVVNGDLVGTAGEDDFVLQADADVAVYEMTVSGMSAVDGNGGTDSLDASAYSAGLALTGTDNQVTAESGTLTFDGIVSAVTSALTGTSGADSFVVNGDNTVTSYDIAFTNVSTVDGDGDSDSVTGANGEDWTLTGTNYQATGSGMIFSNVEALTATNADLIGTTGNDAFVLQSDADVAIYNMTISGMSAVEGNGGTDSLDASTYSDGLALTGTDNQVTAESGSLTFNAIASAITATLTGTSSADSFTVDGDNEVTSYEIAFTGVNTVDAGSGGGNVVAQSIVSLTGTDKEATTNLIAFSNIDSVSGGSLEGSDNADTFEVNSGTAVTANGISFSSLSSTTIDTKDGEDTVTGADGEDWTLTGNSYEATNNGITFSNVETLAATNADLVGTTGADTFVLQSDADVEIYGMTISGMSAVEGNGGTDSLDASAYSDGLALTGTDNQVTAESGSLTFNAIASAVTATLTGTIGADSFAVDGDNAVTSYDIAFTGVSTVDAGNGVDSVTALSVVTLTGTDNQASTNSILFSKIDSVSEGSLQASSGNDSFEVTGANALTANEIAFSSISSVDALGGDDSVTGADGEDWTLTGNNYQATNNGITFSNVEFLTAVNADLIGTTGADAFVLQSDADVAIYNMTISGMSAVEGNGGTDSLDASAYSAGLALTGADNQVTAESGNLTFNAIASAVTAVLTGTSSADSFTVDGDNAVTSYDIAFTGVNTVDAGSGGGSVAAQSIVSLTGTDKEATTNLIAFSNIDSVSGGSLEGSDNADTFAVISGTAVTANGISFSSLSSTTIDTKDGEDTVTGADGEDWTLTGNNYQATNNGITFSNVETLTAVNADLIGTGGNDAFVLQSDADVAIYNMTISGMSAVEGNGGTDSLDASVYSAGLALTGTDNQVTAESGSLTFNDIASAVTAALTGTSGADNFTVSGDNAASAYGVAFTGLNTIDAAGGTDSVTGASGADWALTGTNKEATSSSITFSAVETITLVNGDLVGTAGEDDFVLQADADVAVYDMTVSGMSAVDGNGGTDSLDASAYSAGLALTGTDNQVTAESGTLTFDGIVSAVTSALTGTSGADSFVVNGDNAVTSYDIAFTNVSTVDGDGDTDSVTGANGEDWTLTGTNYQATGSDMTFSNVEALTATNADLIGTTGNDAFVLQSDADVAIYNMTISGMSSVEGNGGTDSLDASAYSAGLALTGTDNQVTAESGSLTFNSIASAVTATLTGTSSADSFTVDGDNAVTSYEIAFTGVNTVDAGSGGGSVAAQSVVTLTGTDNEATTNLIAFSNIDSVSGGSLEGSDNADTFVVTGSTSVTANDIRFSGFSGAIDAKDGTDSVTGASGEDWTLTGNNYEATNNGITFSNVETLAAISADLVGTTGADIFVLQSDADVEIYGMTISGMSAVEGNGGTDSLDASAYSDGLALTGTDNQVSAESGNLTFNDIASAVTAVLTGTSSADSFTVDGDNAVTSYDIAFTGVNTVDAGSGGGSVAAQSIVSLTGTDKEATTNLIAFSNIDSVSGGSLEGSDNADTFEVNSGTAVTANGISFSSLSSTTIDTKDGEDTVTGADGEDWTLTGNSYEATNSGITFSNVETLTAVNAALIGTGGNDAFVLQSDADVAIYNMTISGMSSVEGNGGTDSLDASTYSDGLALTGTDNQVSAESGNLTFNDIASAITATLTGTSSTDSFTVDGDNAVTSYDIAFTGVSTVDAGNGIDSVAALGVVTLTGTDNQLSTNSILFSNIDSVSGGSLEASSGNDSFEVTGANALTANAIAFSSISSVDALGGDDSVTGADGEDWTLTGNNYQATNNGITFSNVEFLTAVNADLIGTTGADAFVLQSDADVAIYNMTISGMSSVEGNGGTDSLDASAYSAGLALTGTDNQVSAESGSLTFNAIASAVTAVLTGTSGADSFTVSGDNAASAYGVAFTGLNTIDAAGGTDSVTGASGADWALTGTNKEATSSNITFSAIETITVVNGDLVGTAGEDDFVLQADADVAVYEMTVSGMSAVDGNGGTDSLDASAYSAGLALTGTDNQVTAESGTLTFDGIVSAVTSALTGTSGADSFVVNGDNAVTSYDIAFTNVSTVDGDGDTDSVTGANGEDWTLTGTNYQATGSDMTFSNVEALTATNADLIGTTGNDAFVLQSDADVAIYNMTISGMSSVEGNGGTDSLDASAYSAGLALTGTDNQVSAESGNLTFNDIASAVTAVLTGTSSADSFTVDGDNAVTSYDIAFTGVSTVDAGNGIDSVAALGVVTLTGTDNQVSTNSILFSNIDSVSGGSLEASSGNDSFEVTGANALTANAIAFSSISSVDALGGDDSVTGADGEDWTLTGNNYQATNNGITFSNVEFLTAVNADLIGTTGADAFVLQSDADVAIYNMTISGMSSVEGNGGTDSLDASAYSAGLALTGTDNQVSAESGNLTFNAIASAVTAVLTGTSGADSFTVSGDNAASAYGVAFTGLNTIDAAGGTDSVTGASGADWALTGTNKEATSSNITFSAIETITVVNGDLVGTAGEDDFVLQADADVAVYEMTVSGMSAVDGNGGTDSLDASAYSAGLALTGTDNQVTAESGTLTFDGIVSAVTSALTGTSGADSFVVNGDNAVTSYDIAFTNVSTVDGDGDTDSVTGANGEDWTLTGTNYQATGSDMTFSNVEALTATNADLIGTTGNDAFVLQSDADVAIYNMTISGMSSVEGNGGTDSLDASAYSDGLALTGTDNQVSAESGNLTFNAIASAITATLTGTSSADSFTVDGDNAVTSYEIAFTGVNTVDAENSTDSVTGADGANWTLTGTGNEAISSGITFSNIDIIAATNADLLGSTGADAFVLQSDADIEVYGLTISGISEVDGNGGTDSLDASAYSDGLALTGTDNQITAESGSLIFNDIASAVTSTLTGTSGADSFTVNGDNQVTSYEIAFTGVNTVDAGNGTDSVAALSVVTLTGIDNQASTNSILFNNIDTVSGGSLQASSGNDSFEVTGANALAANEIEFSSISSVDARGGDDSVTGADGEDWTLTGNNYQATNNGITFSSVEILTAVNADLIGTSGNDAFVLQSDADVAIYNMTISGMSSVEGNGGTDSLDASAYSAGLALTGTDNQVTAESGSLAFNAIASAVTAVLTGTSSADSFTVDGDNAVTSYDIAFTSVSTIDAGDNTDSVVGADGEDWALTGTNYEATGSDIVFSGVEVLTATNADLVGTSDADAFVLQSNADVEAYGMTVSGMSAVDGNGGDDSLDASAYSDGLALTGTNNQVTAESGNLIFHGIVSAVTSALTGSSSTDSFVVDGGNAVSSYSIAFTGVSTVDAANGTDSITGASGSDWTLTGNNKEVIGSGITFSDAETLVTVSANLVGTTGEDVFVLQSDADVEVYGMTVSGMSAVEGNGGDDSLDASAYSDGLTLTGTSKQVTAESGTLTFDGIVSAVTATLTATSGSDSFTVDSANAATVYDIAFTGLSTIDAGEGADSVTGASGADWTLTGNDYEATNSSITFSRVETITAVNADLMGTANADAFVLQSAGDIEVYGMTVSGMSAVDARGGDDSLDASAYSDGLTLTGSDGQVTAGSLAFSSIASAVTSSLTGTSGADSFTVDGNNAVSSYDIAFTGVSTLDADGGTDSVSGAGGADWTLSGTNNQAASSGITFSNVDSLTIVNADLVGTTSADAFVLQSGGDIEVYDMTISGMSAVDGNGGGDNLDASSYSDGLTLTGASNQVAAGSLTFDGIVSAVASILTGTSGADSITVDGNNAVTSYDIAFTGVSTIDAGTGTDSVTGADGEDWTLTGSDNQATGSGITFSNVDSLTTVNADLIGTTGADDFVLQSDADVEAYGITVSGMSSVEGNGGNDSLDASAYSDGLALTGTDNQVTAESGALIFNSIFSAVSSTLTATSGSDNFTVDSDNATTIYDIAFTGLSSIDAAGGADTVTGADGADWTLTGNDYEATNSGITFGSVETLIATNANLLGSSSADAFALQSTGDIEVYSMTVSGMSAVYGQGGNDSLDASAYSDGLTLTGTDNQVTAGSLTFDGIVSAVTSALTGTSGADSFTVDGDNAATSYDIAFTGLSTINALDGNDTATGADGADWSLTGADNKAVNSSITFSNIENLTAVNADLVATTGDDAFVLQSDADVEVYGMTVSAMSAVDGNGGDDSLDASAYSDGLSLTGTDNQVNAGSLSFYSISSAVTSILTNTHDSAQFELQGDQALETAGISFTGLEEVKTSGSNDTLVATDSADNFTLNSDGDISVAGIDFSGLEIVDGAGGSDTVSADGATWTSTSSGNSLVDGSVEAEVNGLTVYFENLELVEGAGSYIGQDIDGEYEFSALDTMTIGGVTFADLNSVAAGSGTDTVYGADIDAVWDINDSEHTVSSGGTSLTITGIESITAGSGADKFNLNGGELTGIDTGAGNDTVTFSGTVIDSIFLGAGNDLLTVETDVGQGVELAGGGGSDDFQYNLSGATWELYSTGNQVGNFSFAGFEYLDNASDSITVLTDLAFDFEDGGSRSESFNKNGAGLQFSDMRLGYDGEGDVYVTSSGTETIGGNLTADRAELVVAGDVDIETDVSVLAIATSGADINISVQATGDLVIDEIDAGRGTVSLASSSFGTLTAETYGDTHITASAVTLGTETELWTIIGEATNPLRMDVTNTLDIYSVSYYEPDFIGQIPTVTSTGDELQSVAGAQASQGLKSAVQNAVEDFSHVDPAIFSAVKPYSSGVDAVNSPEMRLKSGELLPSTVSTDDESAPGSEFDAVLDAGVNEVSDDIASAGG